MSTPLHGLLAMARSPRPRIELALATYERTIVAGEALFDRWIYGDNAAIGAAAKRGFQLFNGKAHCSECHSGLSFTDGSFADIGTAKGDDSRAWRFFPEVESCATRSDPRHGDVARRAPYMHDGSVPTPQAGSISMTRASIERSRSPPIATIPDRGRESGPDQHSCRHRRPHHRQPGSDPAAINSGLARGDSRSEIG